MKVIIPVAGIGNRLKPHTHSLPKPLLSVAGRPILSYILEPLAALEPEEVILVIGHLGDMIRDYVTGNFGFKTRFVQQDELLGLGYATRLAALNLEDSDASLVILGDTIVEADLRAFVEAGRYVLGVRQVDDPHRFGIAEIAQGRVVGVEEKPDRPKTNLALIGLYYFGESGLLKRELDRLVASGKTTNGEIQLTDALSTMIDAGADFVAHEVRGWFDCGKKETLLETNRYLLSKGGGHPQVAGSQIIPPVFLAETARVVNSVIGPYVSISADAEVRNCIVTNSIISSRARVENVILKDSLIGRRAVVRGPEQILNIGDSSEALLI